MSKGHLRKLEQSAAEVERLQRNLEAARERLRIAVADAHNDGESVTEIARRLGVTRTRIYQLLGR
jgi:DNA-directed RNA polymerase specialized sigma24 family protein